MAGVESTLLIDFNLDFKALLIRGYILAHTFNLGSAARINLNINCLTISTKSAFSNLPSSIFNLKSKIELPSLALELIKIEFLARFPK